MGVWDVIYAIDFKMSLESFQTVYLNTSYLSEPKKLLMDQPLQSRQMCHLEFN